MSPDVARTTISRLRALTSRPINVNFFCHAPVHSNVPLEEAWNERLESYYRELSLDRPSPFPRIDLPPFNEAMCSIVEDTRPEVVSFHFGLPEPALLSRVKAAGCLVMSSATTVEEARWLERHKADVIIAQGFEAGGHRGVFLTEDLGSAMASQPTTLALVPQIVDAVSVPVIAAGGIGDGRGIAAAFALGAAGVQIGTGYLLCPEAATSPLYIEAIKQAHSDSTLVTNVLSGRPARALTNRLSRELGPLASDTPGFPIPMGVNAPLRTEAERRGLAILSSLVRPSGATEQRGGRQGSHPGICR